MTPELELLYRILQNIFYPDDDEMNRLCKYRIQEYHKAYELHKAQNLWQCYMFMAVS